MPLEYLIREPIVKPKALVEKGYRAASWRRSSARRQRPSTRAWRFLLGWRTACGTAALLLAAALAGCGSSPERPAGRFVFSSDFATPNASRLFVIGADDSGMHKVTRGLARVGEGDADWSPDGSRIVFDRTFECADPLIVCDAIWVVSADGSGERRLTPQTPGTGGLSPTWSPDGGRIAYALHNDHSDSSDLYTMNADGSGKRRLTHSGDAEEPAWAPDGRRIAFSHDGDIFVLDLDAGTTRQLTQTPSLNESYPDWSPDGKRIAYELNNPSLQDFPFQAYDAYVMDADGTHKRSLSHGHSDGHPVWSPRGQFIAYASDAPPVFGDELAIVIVDAGSGRRVRRIPAPGMDLYPIDWTAG
jgi:Tol biopolymer transport system component